MKKKIVFCLAFLIGISNAFTQQVIGLKCDYYKNPLAIDDTQPQLSWQLISPIRANRQTAYQVLVASSKTNLEKDNGDLWNSGKIESEQSAYITYNGKQLQTRMDCYWKVRIWNNDNRPSDWSEINTWKMGLLTPKDWTAKWITASKWFTPINCRPKGFEVSAKGGWADIDLGKEYPIDSIRLFPSMNLSFPKRFRIEIAKEMLFTNPMTIIDESKEPFNLKERTVQTFRVGNVKTRFIRLQILGDSGKIGSVVRQMEVMSNGKNVALMKFTRERGTSWNTGHAKFLVDGMPSQNEGAICPQDACSIETAPIFRKIFNVDKKIKTASIYYAALGMADITINGKRVGDEELGPPFSDYSKRIYYTTHDITSLLNNGENVIGATLGNGFFSTPRMGFGERHGGDGPPQFLAQTIIEFQDGSKQIINTDDSWQWEKSEIIKNDVFEGYEEDRREEKVGWKLPNYDASKWKKVVIGDGLSGKLFATIAPPIRAWDTLRPKRVEGNHAYFDYVSSGWPQVKVNGKAGQVISISGTGPGFKLKNLVFTLAKDGPTILQPHFVVLPGPNDLIVED